MALTASASLKLDKILSFTVKALAIRLAPLMSLSYVFDAKEVDRDHVCRVPYVPLEALASKDFDGDVGYEEGDFNVDSRSVPINKRKYQPLSFTSSDLVGLPPNVLAEAMAQKADRLAVDVVTDIMSVITLADFGAAVYTGAASGFDSDTIIDLGTTLSGLYWPTVGRNLILDTTYTGNVKKDASVKNADAAGSDMTLREGNIGRLGGFNIDEVPGFPDNSENLKGVAALRYGILIANAPIAPTDEVRDRLYDYRTSTDPKSGLTLTYKAWGSADFDKAKRVLELSYGYAKGDEQQIKRITSA